MISKSIFHFFWFGTCVRYLQDAEEGYTLGEDGGDATIHNLTAFFQYLDELELQVTNRASYELRKFFDELSLLDSKSKLTKTQASRLSKLITELRKTLFAELRGFHAYVVTPKHLDVRRLLEDVPSLLKPEHYNGLPSIAQYDLAEAGKCIAFERPTAAAFHLLRATEGVFRDFYCTLVKQKRCDLMWGPMLADLRKRKKARAHAVLLSNLDNIRKSFRNPTQHPEMTYDIHEVQDLWGLCIDAINRMATASS